MLLYVSAACHRLKEGGLASGQLRSHAFSKVSRYTHACVCVCVCGGALCLRYNVHVSKHTQSHTDKLPWSRNPSVCVCVCVCVCVLGPVVYET